MSHRIYQAQPLNDTEKQLLWDLGRKEWGSEAIQWNQIEQAHRQRVGSEMFLLGAVFCFVLACCLWASAMGWLVSAETMLAPKGTLSAHADIYKGLGGAFLAVCVYFIVGMFASQRHSARFHLGVEEGWPEEHDRYRRHMTMYTGLLYRASATELIELRSAHGLTSWAKLCLERECEQRVVVQADPWGKDKDSQ